MPKKSSKKPSKRLVLTALIAVAAIALVAVLCFVLINRALNSSKAPTVGLLELDHGNLIVHAETGFPEGRNEEIEKEQFVFCVTKIEGEENCNWENYDDFLLTEETTYYVYVKSLSTEKVSAPEVLEYKILDYENMRL